MHQLMDDAAIVWIRKSQAATQPVVDANTNIPTLHHHVFNPVFRGSHLHCHLPPCLGLSLATSPLEYYVEENEAGSAVLWSHLPTKLHMRQVANKSAIIAC